MAMSKQPEDRLKLVIHLELESDTEDGEQPDTAFTYAVGREALANLQATGYPYQPSNTGARGAEIIVDVVVALQGVVHFLVDNKAVIEEIGNGLTTLIAIFSTGVIPIVKAIQHAVIKRDEADSALKITVDIDGTPITVEASDLQQAEAALKMAQRFQRENPSVAANVTPASKVKINGRVHNKKRPRRR